jgi:hypothetical protein
MVKMLEAGTCRTENLLHWTFFTRRKKVNSLKIMAALDLWEIYLKKGDC